MARLLSINLPDFQPLFAIHATSCELIPQIVKSLARAIHYTVQDLRHRRRVSDDREHLEARIAMIAQTAPGALCSFRMRPNGSACFPYVSPRWEDFFHLTQETVKDDATPAFRRIHADDLQPVQESITESARTMTPWRAEFRIMDRLKGEIWLEGHSMPFRELDGSIVWHGFISEITERKKAAAELLAAKNAAELAAKAKAQFLDVAAHELRTPVTSIILLLELAERKILKGEQLDVLSIRKIRSPADRLKVLVSDLLDISRLERGMVELKCTPTDIRALAEECVDEFRMRAPEREIKYRTPDHEIHANIDRTRIYQALSNLLDNAIKYTPAKTSIEVELEASPRSLRVSVIDHGPGISTQNLARLFSLFTRGQSKDESHVAGLGLGLSVSRKLVELHGGTLNFKPTKTGGCTFTIELPS